MAVVLGPELDGFLRGVGDNLKGKTKVNYVDQDTLIHACSAQNKVILLLQEQMLRMQEVERGMQRTLSTLEGKVTYFEKYTKKIDDIEDVLMEKMPLVDKMNEVVKGHNVTIERHVTDFMEHVTEFDTFRDDTKSKMSRTTQDITKMRSQLNLLPKTIVISSRQVTHSIDDEGTNEPAPDGKELLVDVIAQQEQHTYLQDESTKKIQERLDEYVTDQETQNNKVDNEMRDLIDWKVEQSSVDLVEMKASQDSMRNTLENHHTGLCTKMSMQDVNKKLDLQFKDIVEHLQSALTSVEKDEGDFRSITDALSKMCKTLRENKADKSEINALRKQFIQNQIQIEDQIQMEDDFGGISSSGSTLDNESLRKILMDYPTKAMVAKLISTKVDQKKVVPEFVRINTILQSMDGTIRKLAVSSANEALIDQEDFMDSTSSIFDQEEIVSLNDHDEVGGDVERVDGTVGPNSHLFQETPPDGDEIIPLETDMRQDRKIHISKNRHEMNAQLTTKRSRGKTKKSREDPSFPSSNMLSGLLHEIPPNEGALKQYQKNKTIENTGGYLQARPIRPGSAPNSRHESLKQNKLKKKNSLPAILTSISKSIRPRSRMKAKYKNGKNAQKNIHNGSFQVVTSSPRSFELDNSSSHFADLTPVQEHVSPRPSSSSSEHRRRKNQIKIRTSIA